MLDAIIQNNPRMHVSADVLLEIFHYAIHAENSPDSGSPTAVRIASVCTGWRNIVTRCPTLWRHIHLRGFHSNDIAQILSTLFKRAANRNDPDDNLIQRVTLDFIRTSSHQQFHPDQRNALVFMLIEILSHVNHSFRELEITSCNVQILKAITEYFNDTSSCMQQFKLASVKILRLNIVGITPTRPRPRFDASLFTTLDQVYLKNVRLVAPFNVNDTIRNPLCITLQDWDDVIGGSTIDARQISESSTATRDFHLIINRSKLAHLSSPTALESVKALTINAPTSTYQYTLASFFRHVRFPTVSHITLTEITYRDWADSVRLLSQLPYAWFPALEDITINFVQRIDAQAAVGLTEVYKMLNLRIIQERSFGDTIVLQRKP